MKIQIDESGNLGIERGSIFKEQYCPYQDIGTSSEAGIGAWCRCGDWCPMFGEPDWDNPGLHRGVDYLTICNGRVLGGQIKDKRVAQ